MTTPDFSGAGSARLAILCAFSLASFAPSALLADEVTLTNGDHLTGEVVSLDGGSLVFDPDLGPEVTLPWASVSAVEVDEPMDVGLADGRHVVGTVVAAEEEGRVVIRGSGAEAPLEVAVSEVSYLNLPPPDERRSRHLRADVGAGLTRGNTDTDGYRASTELQIRQPSDRYVVGGELDRAEQDGETTVDRASAYARYDRFLSERWFLSANATLTNDAFQQLDLRTVAGAGLGYQIVERADRSLSTNLGVSWLNEDFAVGEDRSTAAGRWALSWEEALLDTDATLVYDHELLQGLESSDDYLLRIRSGLRFPVLDGVAGSLQVGYDYDNTPAPGAEKDDVSLTLALGYQWDSGR